MRKHATNAGETSPPPRDPIPHLPGIAASRVQTTRLNTHVLLAGPADGQPVLFLHGNLSGATFWEETMLALPPAYRAVAPDQRGFGLSDSAAHIDATRGMGDWADDALALADRLGWSQFHCVGHSLGGCVGWALLASHAERLLSLTLIAPGPPGGFPGAHGERGTPNHADGAGSGAGLTHPRFTERLQAGERDISDPLFSPRAVMNRAYWKPPFRPEREESFLTAMLQVHLGPQQFPGDFVASPHWPGFAPGRCGPINALSPRYNQGLLERLIAARSKPRLLWIGGSEDAIVADHSLSDPGQQGLLKLRPGWPGESVFPPQPLRTQVQFALDAYERQGGAVERHELDDVGHSPHLERPYKVQALIRAHLEGSTVG